MDCVKAKAWKDFVVKNSILPPAYDRVIKEDDNPTPFCMTLKNVEGIEVVSFLFYTLLMCCCYFTTLVALYFCCWLVVVLVNESVWLFLADESFHGQAITNCLFLGYTSWQLSSTT